MKKDINMQCTEGKTSATKGDEKLVRSLVITERTVFFYQQGFLS